MHTETVQMCSIRTTSVYFVDWQTTTKDFVKGIKFTTSQRDLKVHIFYNKKTPKQDLPPDYEWIVKHPTLTSSQDASWTALLTYLLYFYTRLSCNCTESRCKLWPNSHVHKRYKANVVCGEESRYAELAAILTFNNIPVKIVNAEEKTLLELFSFSCGRCKIIFKDKREADKHDHAHHNFLCDNPKCERSKRENGFFAKKELQEHLTGKTSCQFCPEKVFCTAKKLEEHMTKTHKKCDCSCGKYFETPSDCLEHFYSTFPLPCLEDPSCTERFPNIEFQAFHHKSFHGATYPYYCMACYKNNYLVCLKTAEELLNHVEREKHQQEDFSFAQIPLHFARTDQNS